MDPLSHNDQPISEPSEDRFGIDPFARALASSIRRLKAPTGSVVAVNGPWGSGKSSAVNLIRHHLADAVKADELVVIDFACWWFRGEDALALAFFRELYAGFAPSLGEKIKKALPKLGARLLRAGSVLGGAADVAGAGGIGKAAGSAMEWIGGLIEQDESVEKLHSDLSRALAEQKKRFLVIVDDIDRLSPDEALLIFRLVKSVGRLPNVMYLLVYDRQLAEKIVSERYPSEGPHYLEKIVQAAFELPEPSPADLQAHLLSQIAAICGTPGEDDVTRFMNVFHDGIAHLVRTPRDVARFANALAVTWPAVEGEVNLADFLALEVCRLLYPSTYRAVRQNKSLMCDASPDVRGNRAVAAEKYRELLFGTEPPAQHEQLRRLLMRLFPALESVWANMGYGEGFARRWAAERRVCSKAHFDSYFRFTVGEDILPRAELEEFMRRAGDREYVIATMRDAVKVVRRAGGTKAAVLLSELDTHADRISREQVPSLLAALFSIADELNVEADEAGAFSIGSNELRLHWLLRSLTRERMTLEERSSLFVEACQGASIGWLADFVRSAWNDHHPPEDRPPEPVERCLTSEADAGRLRELLRARLTAAADDGSLALHRQLAFLLYWWLDLADAGGAAIRAWATALMDTEVGVRQLVNAFTSYGWSQGMGLHGLGDAVAKRTTHARVKSLGKFVDLDVFRCRAEEVAAKGEAPEVIEFLHAWDQPEWGEPG